MEQVNANARVRKDDGIGAAPKEPRIEPEESRNPSERQRGRSASQESGNSLERQRGSSALERQRDGNAFALVCGPTLTDLPNELLLIVFEHLFGIEPVTLFGSVTRVCKRFNQLCDHVLGRFDLTIHPQWPKAVFTERLEFFHQGFQTPSVLTLPSFKALRPTLETLEIPLSEAEKLQDHAEELRIVQGIRVIDTGDRTDLPESITALTNIQRLSVVKSRIQTLPLSLGSLIRLTHLYLHNNRLTELPETVGLLNKLTVLDVSSNHRLRQLPESIGDLKCLAELRAGSCALERLPTKIGQLTKLEVLIISRNLQLRELPKSIGNLRCLKVLRVGSCGLERLPTEIGRLTKLEFISASHNRIRQVPEAITALTHLMYFSVKDTEITHLPEGLANLRQLRQLKLNNCRALRVLPESVGGLEKLEVMTLTNCSALDVLPESIGNLVHLKVLNLTGCKHCPDSVQKLKRLKVLFLARMELEALPKFIHKLRSLVILDISDNEGLTKLPSSLKYLKRLRRIKLEGTAIATSGDIVRPDWLNPRVVFA